MRAVEQAQERALGHGRRQVLQLPQAIEPQLPHAIEVVVAQARPDQQVAEQRRATRRQTASASSA